MYDAAASKRLKQITPLLLLKSQNYDNKCLLIYKNTRSIKSCVQKFKSTKNPSSEYDIPYIFLNVAKRSGGRQNADAPASVV